MIRVALLFCVMLLSLAACGNYDPPFRGDHASEQYKSDLAACRASAREAVRLKNAATPQSWIVSPFTGPPETRAKIRACMQAKGYVPAHRG
jgi:hypothetical protein